MRDPGVSRPRAHVRILGVDGAVPVRIRGMELYLGHAARRAAEWRGCSAAKRKSWFGDGAAACAGPLNRRWIAQVLAERGLPTAEIARRLRATDVAAAGSTRGPEPGSFGRPAAQLKPSDHHARKPLRGFPPGRTSILPITRAGSVSHGSGIASRSGRLRKRLGIELAAMLAVILRSSATG